MLVKACPTMPCIRLVYSHIKPCCPVVTNLHAPATAVLPSIGAQISTCEKVRLDKASPGGHVKLTNLHWNPAGGGVGVGVGTGIGLDTGVGVSVETDPCDMTWQYGMQRSRKINTFIAVKDFAKQVARL